MSRRGTLCGKGFVHSVLGCLLECIKGWVYWDGKIGVGLGKECRKRMENRNIDVNEFKECWGS